MVGAQGLADQRGAKAVQQLKVAAEALQGLGWLAYAGPTSGEHKRMAGCSSWCY
jgi:hypothetical protein